MKSFTLFFLVVVFAAHAFLQVSPCYYGTASWYSETDPGICRLTASGEVFDDRQATCASWKFPFGTYVKVTNVQDGRSVVCRVNDRGPEASLDRVIDLSKSSFEKIADPDIGLIKVMITPLKMG